MRWCSGFLACKRTNRREAATLEASNLMIKTQLKLNWLENLEFNTLLNLPLRLLRMTSSKELYQHQCKKRKTNLKEYHNNCLKQMLRRKSVYHSGLTMNTSCLKLKKQAFAKVRKHQQAKKAKSPHLLNKVPKLLLKTKSSSISAMETSILLSHVQETTFFSN